MISKNYRPDIDGLRPLAISAVVLFHFLPPALPGGFVGVDVFFVISGYLITQQILGHTGNATSFGRFLLWFYSRRTRRILPAYIFISSITALTAAFVFVPHDFVEFARSLLASTLLSANIYFWMGAGYFAQDAGTQPLLHYWSLGVEEHFYLLFPLIMYALRRLSVQRLAITLVGLAFLSFASAAYAIEGHPHAVFYWIQFRAWELLIGSVLALTVLPAPGKYAGALAAVFGLMIIAATAAAYWSGMQFPGPSAAPPVLAQRW